MRSTLAVLLLAISTACAGGDTAAGDTAASTASTPAASSTPSGDACIVGTWTQPSTSFSPKFVFNADGTGEETMAESQGGKTRSFNWKMNAADKVTITFPAEGSQTANSTDWSVDCQRPSFANMYTKQ